MTPYENADWMRMQLIQEILRTKMLDLGRIANLMHLVRTVPRGAEVAEFGTYKGNTACLLSTLIERPIWIYDSFEGLPEPDPGCAINFQKGKLASTVEEVERLFRSFSQLRPKIVKGWFEQLRDEDLPERFSFVHVDADMFAGTTAVLEKVWPRLIVGGIIVIDDYGHPGLPGVQAAAKVFFDRLKVSVYKLETTGESGQAMVTKPWPN
jgi:O-methyltransferase